MNLVCMQIPGRLRKHNVHPYSKQNTSPSKFKCLFLKSEVWGHQSSFLLLSTDACWLQLGTGFLILCHLQLQKGNYWHNSPSFGKIITYPLRFNLCKTFLSSICSWFWFSGLTQWSDHCAKIVKSKQKTGETLKANSKALHSQLFSPRSPIRDLLWEIRKTFT